MRQTIFAQKPQFIPTHSDENREVPFSSLWPELYLPIRLSTGGSRYPAVSCLTASPQDTTQPKATTIQRGVTRSLNLHECSPARRACYHTRSCQRPRPRGRARQHFLTANRTLRNDRTRYISPRYAIVLADQLRVGPILLGQIPLRQYEYTSTTRPDTSAALPCFRTMYVRLFSGILSDRLLRTNRLCRRSAATTTSPLTPTAIRARGDLYA